MMSKRMQHAVRSATHIWRSLPTEPQELATPLAGCGSMSTVMISGYSSQASPLSLQLYFHCMATPHIAVQLGAPVYTTY